MTAGNFLGYIGEIRDKLQLRDSIVGYKTEGERKVEDAIKDEVEKKKRLNYQRLDRHTFESTILSEDKSSILGLTEDKVKLPRINDSKSEIVQQALKTIRSKVNCKVASIFTFSKDGALERVGLLGRDIHDEVISEWSFQEAYQIGSEFVGKVLSKSKSGFGEPRFTTEFLNELSSEVKEEYSRKFKDLGSAIAIPINGRNKTYGVVQVVGGSEGFFEEELKVLSSLAGYTATALSNFRRDIQADIFKHLSQLLILSPEANDILFQQVADLLILNPETAFKACVLRIEDDDDGKFHIRGMSIWPSDSSQEERDNSPVDSNAGLVGKVIETGERIIIQNIRQSENIAKFRNRPWIESKKLDAFGCFPLTSKDQTVGTISLYTGFNYNFHPDSIEFVQSIANLVALFVVKVKQDQYTSGRYTLEEAVHLIQARYRSKMSSRSRRKQHVKAFSSLSHKKRYLEDSFLNARKRRTQESHALLRILSVVIVWFLVLFVGRYITLLSLSAILAIFAFICMYVVSELVCLRQLAEIDRPGKY